MLPLMTALFLAGSWSWALSRWARMLRIQDPNRFGAVLGLGLTTVLLWGCPNPLQSLLWGPGAMTYLWPLGFTGLLVGECLGRQGHVGSGGRIRSLFWLFLAAGFHEAWALLLLCGLVLWLLGTGSGWWNQRSECRRVWDGAMFVVGVLSLGIHLAVPGNWARSAQLGGERSLAAVGKGLVQFFLNGSGLNWRFLALLLLLLPLLRALETPRGRDMVGRWSPRLLLLPLGGALLGQVVLALPALVGTGQGPVPRMEVLGLCLWLCGALPLLLWLAWAPVAGGPSRAWEVAMGLVLLVMVLPAAGRWRREMVRHADVWGVREQTLAQQARNPVDLRVPALPCPRLMDSLEEVGGDARFWVNRTLSRYYRIRSLRTRRYPKGGDIHLPGFLRHAQPILYPVPPHPVPVSGAGSRRDAVFAGQVGEDGEVPRAATGLHACV